jgi:hypothetical protein
MQIIDTMLQDPLLDPFRKTPYSTRSSYLQGQSSKKRHFYFCSVIFFSRLAESIVNQAEFIAFSFLCLAYPTELTPFCHDQHDANDPDDEGPSPKFLHQPFFLFEAGRRVCHIDGRFY